jgi:hypothetical protein
MNENTEIKIVDFFKGRPKAFKLFQKLRKVIEKESSTKITVTKTQISFGEAYKYIWVWLPQMWITKRPDSSITLTIATGKKLNHNRITESVSPKKGFWTHHILINHQNEIDNELGDLIQASYQFYRERKEKKDWKSHTKTNHINTSSIKATKHLKKNAIRSKRFDFILEHRGGPLSKENHRQLSKWARRCVLHVLAKLDREDIDKRLKEALHTAEQWEKSLIPTGDAMKASLKAHSVARESRDPVMKMIARSVGQAVATAHMADHSLGAAYYALKAVKVSNKNIEKEKEWQNKILPQELKTIVQSHWKTKGLDQLI